MERETIDFIASCEEACFPRPWTSDEVQSCICGEYGVCVIENGIGYAIGRISFDEAELYRIAVLPEKRRAGAGKRLLTGFIDECVRRGLKRYFSKCAPKTFLLCRFMNSSDLRVFRCAEATTETTMHLYTV